MNYHKEMIKEISKFENKPKLLLHSCCGPCSTYVIDFLSKYFDLIVYFYNPNIYPESEYLKRANVQKDFINKYNQEIDYLIEYYDSGEYDKAVHGFEALGEKSERCFHCYRFRLEKAFEKAKELKCDYVCSTISVSKHKNVEYLTEVGRKQQEKTGIKYLISDFKKNNGYQQTIIMSKEYDLYRQDYCGCVYSLKEK